MNCPLNREDGFELLLDYCAGSVADVSVSAAIETHVAECPECRQFVAAQGTMWAALDDWEDVAVSAGFDRQLYDRIAAEESKSAWWRRFVPAGGWNWRTTVPAGAACAAALAAVMFVAMPGGRMGVSLPPDPPPHVENSRVETIEPEQVERALDDLDMLKQLSTTATSQNL